MLVKGKYDICFNFVSFRGLEWKRELEERDGERRKCSFIIGE